jgi:hypothetical protein
MLFKDRLAVAPNSFVDPEIGAQATQNALLMNLYSARLFGWQVRAPLKGPDDPALYQIVKKWKKANRRGYAAEGYRRSGVLDLTTLDDMSSDITLREIGIESSRTQPVPVEIDLSAYSRQGVLTNQQLGSDDRWFLDDFKRRDREVSNFRDTVASLREQEKQKERNQNWQLKKNLMWGAAALGAVGLVFFLRRRK